MPILHSSGVITPGQFGPDQPHAGAVDDLGRADHVADRDAFGDGDHDADAGVGRFHDGVGGEGRRHEDHRGVGPGLLHGLGHRIEDRNALAGPSK